MIPYGRQLIDDEDIKAVSEVLKSDFITTGPKIKEFEKAICDFTEVEFATAVSNGTSALHAIMYAIGIGPGDEVIVPTMTFAASANSVVYQGGTPVFADVKKEDLLIDPKSVEKLITNNTKAILAVDYAGKACDYEELRKIADTHNLYLLSDACHSLGGKYHDRNVGLLADMTALSFHPVKQITTGEGGMVLTSDKELAQKSMFFRNHGITTDYHQREKVGAWYYEMTDLGYNYRITDFQCALGISQLTKFPEWLKARNRIAETYIEKLSDIKGIEPLATDGNIYNAYHLFVIKVASDIRDQLFKEMRDMDIGVNVHYIPVHFHPYYTKKYGSLKGLCPVAESEYEKILSLPIYPSLTEDEQKYVIDTLKKLLAK